MRNGWKFYAGYGAVIAFLALFLLYPVIYILQGSVVIEEQGVRHWTLLFFKLFAQSPLMWKCLANSLLLAALTTLFCTLIALPLAAVFARYDFPLKTLWQALLMAPLILPPFVGAIGIEQLLGRFGALNHFLGLVGPGVTHPHPVDWLGSGGFCGVVIMQSLHLFPIFFLNLSAALANINPSMKEAARCLGASRSHIFRTVTLPLLKPALFAGGVIVFVWAFTDLGTPLIFGFYKVVAVQIFDRVTETGFNPFGYTLVVVVLLVTLGLFFWSRRVLARQDYVSQSKASTGEELIVLRGKPRVWLMFALSSLCVVTLLPHASVVVQSLSGKWFMSALPNEWTLSHFKEIFTLSQTLTGIKNSFLYAGLSAMVDVVLGVMIAYWIARREFVGKALLDALTVLPLALPGIVLAFGYVAAFNIPREWHGYDLRPLKSWIDPRENPFLLLVISYSVRRLPYMVRATHAGLQQVSVSLEEASRNLGATPFVTLRRIVLPLLKGNILAGAVLTFAFAFLEVSDSLILAMKERFYPVTKTIWALMGRIEPGSASVACALGVLGMAMLFASFYLATRLLGKKMGTLFG